MNQNQGKFGEMIDLLVTQKEFLLRHIREGATVVDFTMGNGHDTAFLSKAVGESGKVYAFDVLPAALESTKKTLEAENCPNNVTLILDSHSNAENYIDGEIDGGMFNLGFMPGGDHTKHTMRETTIPAVKSAVEMLAHGGALTVAVYPGHEEGDLEGQELMEYYASLDRRKICCTQIKIVNSPTAPYFTLIEKK